MGIEHEWQQKLTQIVLDQSIPPFEEGDLAQGRTPNQRALGRALYFLDSHLAGRNEDQRKSLRYLIDLFEEQRVYGHMARKPQREIPPGGVAPNEMFIPGNHYPIWLNAVASILNYATQWHFDRAATGALERRVHVLASEWFVRHTAANSACATPEGFIVAVGARALQKGGPTSGIRDAVYQEIRGLQLTGKAKTAAWWKREEPATVGAFLVRQMVDRGDPAMQRARLATFSDLPIMFDRVEIQRYAEGHTASCPGMRALKPVTFVWADYRDGQRGFDEASAPDFPGPSEAVVIHGHDEPAVEPTAEAPAGVS